MNLALFFRVTSVFLILFALQLLLNAFHEATEANVLLVPAVWLIVAALQARHGRRLERA